MPNVWLAVAVTLQQCHMIVVECTDRAADFTFFMKAHTIIHEMSFKMNAKNTLKTLTFLEIQLFYPNIAVVKESSKTLQTFAPRTVYLSR